MPNATNGRLAPRRKKDWAAKAVENWLRANGVKPYRDTHRARLHHIYLAAALAVVLSFACGIGIGIGIVAAHHDVTAAQQWYRLATWEPPLP